MLSKVWNFLRHFIWLFYAIAVVVWLGVVSWQTIPYSTRLFGFDEANLGGVPVQGFACPLYATTRVGVSADIPELVGQPVIYQTNFSIIPADVSQGFQLVCSPLTTNTPPIAAKATCFFNISDLKSANSGTWFLIVAASQHDPTNTGVVNDFYSGLCLIRTEAIWTHDLITAGLAIITELALVILGTFVWRRGIAGKVVMVIAMPLMWYIGGLAAGLILAGYLVWTYFAAGALIITAIIVLRVWLSTRAKATHDS